MKILRTASSRSNFTGSYKKKSVVHYRKFKLSTQIVYSFFASIVSFL